MEVICLLNEINEVAAILNGNRINRKYTYRTCYLLAKYYNSLDYDPIKIREEIFNWGKKHQVYITDDLNSIIQRALHDNSKIINSVEIKISKNDIEEIKKRFDKYNTQLTAFAILCFAKKHADKNGLFYISQVGLSNWIGIHDTNISNRYIKELIDFKYLNKVSRNKIKYIARRKKTVSKLLVYKMKVDYSNNGIYIFKDQNIREEFEKLFSYI